MDTFQIKQEELCVWIWSDPQKQKSKINILMNKIKNVFNFNENQLAQIKRKLNTSFLPAYTRYWNKCKRLQRTFKKQFKSFIEEIFKVEFSTAISLNSSVSSTSQDSTRRSRGRPKLSYKDCSIRSKRRRKS